MSPRNTPLQPAGQPADRRPAILGLNHACTGARCRFCHVLRKAARLPA